MHSSNRHKTSGEMPTYEQVFYEYRQPLTELATGWLGSVMDAEDVVMEVFIRYWPRHQMFANKYASRAYLLASIKHACLNFRRKSKHDAAVNAFYGYAWEDDKNILEQWVRQDTLNEACSVLSTLPEGCRRVFILCYLKSVQERTVAAVSNVSHHTIRNQKVRGLQLIKHRFSLRENPAGAWKYGCVRKAS